MDEHNGWFPTGVSGFDLGSFARRNAWCCSHIIPTDSPEFDVG
jgi:hypothetical protein